MRSPDLNLPPPPSPRGAYQPVVVHGGLAYVSGMLPLDGDRLLWSGKVPSVVSEQEAQQAARAAARNALAVLKKALGDLDRIDRVIRVVGYVASEPGFHGQAAVLNGASELFQEVFGARGTHARAAVGVAELPMGAPVEIEVLVAVKRT